MSATNCLVAVVTVLLLGCLALMIAGQLTPFASLPVVSTPKDYHIEYFHWEVCVVGQHTNLLTVVNTSNCGTYEKTGALSCKKDAIVASRATAIVSCVFCVVYILFVLEKVWSCNCVHDRALAVLQRIVLVLSVACAFTTFGLEISIWMMKQEGCRNETLKENGASAGPSPWLFLSAAVLEMAAAVVVELKLMDLSSSLFG